MDQRPQIFCLSSENSMSMALPPVSDLLSPFPDGIFTDPAGVQLDDALL